MSRSKLFWKTTPETRDWIARAVMQFLGQTSALYTEREVVAMIAAYRS